MIISSLVKVLNFYKAEGNLFFKIWILTFSLCFFRNHGSHCLFEKLNNEQSLSRKL